jgi:hypothetical protein
MLSISVDASAVEQQFSEMTNSLAEFEHEMRQEFITWQSDDMNRKRPQASETPNGVETIVFPRSNRPRLGYYRYRPGKKLLLKRPPIKGQRQPILRPILYERLCERMRELMSRELSWE